MDRDIIDFISEALIDLYKEFNNTINVYTAIQLSKNLNNPQTWKKHQMAQQNQYRKAMKKLFKEFENKLNKPIENAFKEVNKEAKSDLDAKKKDVPNPQPDIKKFKAENAIILAALFKKTQSGFRRIVNDTQREIVRGKITSGDELLKHINKAMDRGIENMQNVVYRNGRQVSYKAYMEMNVRTTMNQEANNYQIEAARSVGAVFYLCSFFGDCAPDHAEFQGRIYYDEQWQSIAPKEQHEQIEQYISSNQLMSLQSVRDQKPYLTTRPNCRHTFKPLTIEQVLNKSDNQLLDEFKMKQGSYDKKKYLNLQEQRRLERYVRKNKEEVDKYTALRSNATTSEQKQYLDGLIKESNAKVKNGQSEIRSLLKKNPYLERDYRRENYKTIVQDVGAKYNRDK